MWLARTLGVIFAMVTTDPYFPLPPAIPSADEAQIPPDEELRAECMAGIQDLLDDGMEMRESRFSYAEPWGKLLRIEYVMPGFVRVQRLICWRAANGKIVTQFEGAEEE